MGKIASELSDVVVLTSDNPRSEDPEEIIRQIKAGVVKQVFTVPDRAKAVRFALTEARPGDVVVLCGKGAEEYMEIAGENIPYSDRQTCLDFIGSYHCHA